MNSYKAKLERFISKLEVDLGKLETIKNTPTVGSSTWHRIDAEVILLNKLLYELGKGEDGKDE